MSEYLFDTVGDAKAFMHRLIVRGYSFTAKLVTHPKRLKKRMQTKVTVYARTD